jgi:acyl carrier protein phosphodiesterase
VNFLGHIFLSPSDDQILLGNFIADSVKGDPNKHYAGRVLEGVKFHRAIDYFTDHHEVVRQGVARFRESQGRWAPVVIDVIYDHILASDWNLHHHQELYPFVQNVYGKLEAQKHHFPTAVERYFMYMKTQNWLFNYQYEWGLLKSLRGLDRRTSIETKMYRAIEVFKKDEQAFRTEFKSFIADAQKMSEDYFST